MARRRPAAQPVLITTAALSRAQEHANRRRSYTIVMATRVVCFILAVAISVTWLRIIFITGALVLPWVAVLAANQVHGRAPAGPPTYVPAPRRALADGEEPEPHRAGRPY